MGKLVVHNHFKQPKKEKREQEVLQIILSMMKKKSVDKSRG